MENKKYTWKLQKMKIKKPFHMVGPDWCPTHHFSNMRFVNYFLK
jgi:hypothetical protein